MLARIKKRELGQSLIEVIIAITITAAVLGALVVLILSSMKNAQFASSQSKATKYAQEALERIKTIRDRDESIIFTHYNGDTNKFSELWNISMGSQTSCTDGDCFFKFIGDLSLQQVHSSGSKVPLGDANFTRQIIITEVAPDTTDEKKVIVKVLWADSSGEHESNLQTILTEH